MTGYIKAAVQLPNPKGVMSGLNLLDEVVDELEQSDNVMRIKRLILFTCHDHWVNDVKDLQNVDLKELIQELLAVIPNLNNLKLALRSHVKKLSKPGAYLLAADMIIDTIGQLYALGAYDTPESLPLLVQDDRFLVQPSGTSPSPQSAIKLQPASMEGLQEAVPVNFAMGGGSQFQPLEEASEVTSPREDTQPASKPPKPDYIAKPFELRYAISNTVSPLRAKILIFSSLHYKFSPRDRDWAHLNSHDLDDLLLELFQTCETFEDLESKLYATAQQLDDPQENTQVAGLISEALRSLY
jgi:hypothetical protein